MDVTIYDLIMPAAMVAIWMIIRAMSPSVKKLNFKPLLDDLYIMASSIVSVPMVVLNHIATIFKTAVQAISVIVAGILAFIVLAFDVIIQITILIKDFITFKE